jgi:hypothetical protein
MASMISSEASRRLNRENGRMVRQLFEDARATPGFSGIDSWIAETAELTGFDAKAIRAEINRMQQLAVAHRRLAAATFAQQEADRIGATQAAALETLQELLKAEKHTLLVDADRRPILDVNGQKQFICVPDNASRAKAAALLLGVHGSMAPKKIELKTEVTHSHKTEAELREELKAIMSAMASEGVIEFSLTDTPKELASGGDSDLAG